MPSVGLVMLACRDFEAMEIALACHAAYLPPGVRLHVLQNCRGCYDSERTLGVARRYATLFPTRIAVVETIPPGPPYQSIATLLESPELAACDLICKVDGDAFPIAPGWLEALVKCWREESVRPGRPLAYVTPLINDNCWGFPEVLDAMGLRGQFLRDAGREHVVGDGGDIRVLPPDQISSAGQGTIWRYPHIARWLHERTTLQPDRFIAATQALPSREVPSADRYSIGCILFQRELWSRIDDGTRDDEGMLHQHCRRTGERIVCARSIPFVHLAHFTHREENRDLLDEVRRTYEPRLGHSFRIGTQPDRLREIESRLRGIESLAIVIAARSSQHPPEPPTASTPRQQSCEIVVARYGEDVSWTAAMRDFTTIYNKGAPLEGIDETPLPNVGRESHTYLHHIVENYDSLADRTLFIQGQWLDHMNYVLSPDLSIYFVVPRDFVSCGPFHSEVDWTRPIQHRAKWHDDLTSGRMRPFPGTLGDWWDSVLQIARKPVIGIQWSAIFAVTRRLIHSKPRAYYQHLMRQVDDHPNPEAGHYMERSWFEMFTSPLLPTSPFAGERTAGAHGS